MRQELRLILWSFLVLVFACASPRLYFLSSELPQLENNSKLIVAPGPWTHPDVPVVYADLGAVPDDLVLPALKTLMALPGAADACDGNTGRPRPDATEYCLAVYRTPKDWRVSWPVRKQMGERRGCQPPMGGVVDQDFGSDLPIFGFAHNHPCGTDMSSADLRVFPAVRLGEARWTMIEYAVAPGGKPARDSRGRPIAAWAWLATGHADTPRFLKWNFEGEVFRWSEPERRWQFEARCEPAPPSNIGSTLSPPKCYPR
ncbi:hypothetical protein [Corallococcus aberystwythensis]|uniref:Uncharacterized protein n=1 Tax=Corallococcus aberystwythensis TaxID=2316722 RepID=A0A3A8QH56_9BACT|nr:hypothetical protein [Corallococcus aberystwythensis]RKH67937.1 hypothetical protein D7W81_13200 [Corallococcus aberystwythensis]